MWNELILEDLRNQMLARRKEYVELWEKDINSRYYEERIQVIDKELFVIERKLDELNKECVKSGQDN